MTDRNNTDENPPQPRAFPPEMVQDLDSQTVSHEVRHYLWSMEPVYYENVSAHMRRDLVARFVAFEMRNLPPENFRRVRILADLYNLKEILELVESFLNRRETTPDELDRSIYATIILEEIGGEAHRGRAAQYYEYLVSHPLAVERFADLVRCLAAFGNRPRPDSLYARMQLEIRNLSAREASQPEAGVEKRAIEELADNEFFLIEEANKSRQRIAAIADPNARLLELVKAYLQLTDDAGAEYFDLWTQQQIRRTAEREGNERVIEAFRFTVRNLRQTEPEDEVFSKVRALNAIEFFLGKLDADEEEFMNKHRRNQIDPLRYQPVTPHFEEPHESEEEFDEVV
jgi:hypothetical protein